MVEVTYVSFSGERRTVSVQVGYSVMEGAIANGVDGIEAVCGGNSYCGTCRVYVDEAWRARTGEPSEVEASILESTGDEEPSARLSCQILVDETLGGLVVRLPEAQC